MIDTVFRVFLSSGWGVRNVAHSAVGKGELLFVGFGGEDCVVLWGEFGENTLTYNFS